MAQVSQAREMDLLLPAVDLAVAERGENPPEVKIVLWKHDGFSVHFTRRADANKRRLVEAVNARCAGAGLPDGAARDVGPGPRDALDSPEGAARRGIHSPLPEGV